MREVDEVRGIISPIGTSVSFDRDPKTVTLAKKLIAVLEEEGLSYGYAGHVLSVTQSLLERRLERIRLSQVLDKRQT